MPRRTPRLQCLLAALDRAGGAAPRRPLRDAWHRILRENVVYLVDEATRDRAFAALKKVTGLDAAAIARCPDELLLEVCGGGRMAPQQVAKLRSCAELFAAVGDPRALVQLPRPAAKKALKRFPGIGDPGVDVLRMHAGAEAVLGVESNALRVLLRLGYGEDRGGYARQYRTAQQAAMAELPATAAALTQASAMLRRHGQEVCRTTRPACAGCALRRDCPTAKAATG
ncbi:MAG: hypothetical protein AB7O97_16735 [Planctomycetota bacterium]